MISNSLHKFRYKHGVAPRKIADKCTAIIAKGVVHRREKKLASNLYCHGFALNRGVNTCYVVDLDATTKKQKNGDFERFLRFFDAKVGVSRSGYY